MFQFNTYHGCNQYCFKDGTRKLVIKRCEKATFFPYWKLPKDATNSIANSTRSKLKVKPVATLDEIDQYRHEQNWNVSTANYYIPNEATTDSTGETLIIVKPKQEQITNDT